MSKRNILEGWLSFEAAVIPAGAVCRSRNSQQAFYAGALTMFNAMMDLDPGDEPTEGDLEQMDKLLAELQAFGEMAGGAKFN